MATPEIHQRRSDVRAHLSNARMRSDEVFALLNPEALYERPIPERHRLVFYLGHLEAFDWNVICAGHFNMASPNPEFDRLFAFGIDPVNGSLPRDVPKDWPRKEEIVRYNARIRRAIDACLDRIEEDQLYWVAVEHRLMHAETLAYMLHWLPRQMKARPSNVTHAGDAHSVKPRRVLIPQGAATLGLNRNAGSFGWDNEFDAHVVQVPAFEMDAYKVTNGQYLEFVRAGGYEDRSFWSEDSWNWIRTSGIRHPKFWKPSANGWLFRTMFEEIEMPASWPVYVSHAEASAYCRWRGAELPTEAQFHRAAFGTPDGMERAYPWGDEPPQRQHGNFDFLGWDPAPVNAHPGGMSAFGIADLVGNGWEWTSTPFAPFQGFERFAFYPGYSADFFDGGHYVMKGGSSRTAALLLRRSFRNWFQPRYPNIYASFRSVQN